jgi:hypothetical protein
VRQPRRGTGEVVAVRRHVMGGQMANGRRHCGATRRALHWGLSGGWGTPMSNNKLLLLARDLRARAEGLLLKAETMTDPGARSQMREIAARYERLAKRLEKEAGEGVDDT